MTNAIARVQALPSVPEPGDVSEAVLRIAGTNSSPMTMSSPLNGAEGLIGNNGRNTADAWDANASATSIATAAHFIFMEVQTPFPD